MKRLLRCFALILAAAGLAAAAPAPLAAQPGPLPPGVYRLSGTDPALPQGDLEPLRKIVGKATFVGLGESIHTSGGFYQLKDRTLRFLIERMGFRAFGMETPWYRADQVESYVQTCQGTARDAIHGIFSVWQSTEVESMVQWMCEWNAAHPKDRVHFYGFDIQSQSLVDGPALIDFLHRLGIGDGAPRVAGIRACDGVETDYYLAGAPFPPELYQQCQEALAGVASFFDRNEKTIARRTSKKDLGWARVHLVGLRAWQEETFHLDADPDRGGRARDRGMAYTVQAIRALRFPKARTVLWAHNGHLAKKVGSSNYVAVEMGTLLAAQLKEKYAVVGLVARQTFIDWRTLGCGLARGFSTGAGSVENLFHALEPGAGVLADLKNPQYLEPGAVYTVGSVSMVPSEQFDAILYLEVSPKM